MLKNNPTDIQILVWQRIINLFYTEVMNPMEFLRLKQAALLFALDHQNEDDENCQWKIFASCYENKNVESFWDNEQVLYFYKIIQNHYDPMENK